MSLGLKVFFKPGLALEGSRVGARQPAASHGFRELAAGAGDGLVASFAVGAGVLGAASNARTALWSGLAILVGGTIARALRALLSTKGERPRSIQAQQQDYEIIAFPETGSAQVRSILEKSGYAGPALEPTPVLAGLGGALGYGLGAAMSVLPYALLESPAPALASSAGLTLAALLGVGAARARVDGRSKWSGALAAALVGACAGAASFGAGRLLAG